MRSFPNFHDEAFAESQFGHLEDQDRLLVLP